MDSEKKTINILIAEDDEDSFLLIQEAFRQSKFINNLFRVEDGEELMDFLAHRGKYEDPKLAPRPGIILLDLNMPRKDGREALKEIKANPDYRKIPVVIMTASKAEEDIVRSYDLGASSYIRKPLSFLELVDIIKIMKRYWLEIVELTP